MRNNNCNIMMGNNQNNINISQFQRQLFILDNRLELKTAQMHCFNVAGRMLCAAEHLSYLLKNKNLPKQREIFGYYNTYNFADTKNINELKSNMIEQMDNFSRMKRKYKQIFTINLILPLKKEELKKLFNFLKDGLDDKNQKLYESMLNLLINEKKNDDSQVVIDNYYQSFDNMQNQKLEFDPQYLMSYYPKIENNIRNLRNELQTKIEKDKEFKPTMKLNEESLRSIIEDKINKGNVNEESINKKDESMINAELNDSEDLSN